MKKLIITFLLLLINQNNCMAMESAENTKETKKSVNSPAESIKAQVLQELKDRAKKKAEIRKLCDAWRDAIRDELEEELLSKAQRECTNY